MNSNNFKGNFENKSEIIRSVYRLKPLATNREIKKTIFENYGGLVVSSQLIISSIGKYKTRSNPAAAKNALEVATKYLKLFAEDLDFAYYWLKRAAV